MPHLLLKVSALLAGVISTISAAQAQTWIKLHSTSRYDAYYEVTSVSRSGEFGALMYLSDLKVKHVYASAVSQAEFDCEKKLMRIVSTHEYSEQMGRGNSKQVISKPMLWDTVEQGTIAALLMQLACVTPTSDKEGGSSSTVRLAPSSAPNGSNSLRTYDPIAQSNAKLRSLYSLKEAAGYVGINYRFFAPIKDGESHNAIVARMTGKDPIDAALQFDGRIHKNLQIMLASKLTSKYSIKAVDWKEAPFRVSLEIRVNQSLDLYGKDMFEVLATLEPQEFATGNSGLHGFMSVSQYMAQTFAQSKEGIEGKIYEALDKSLDELGRDLKKAQMYCANSSCALPSGSMRGFTR